jgi:enterochelin esterase-like enzyme
LFFIILCISLALCGCGSDKQSVSDPDDNRGSSIESSTNDAADDATGKNDGLASGGSKYKGNSAFVGDDASAGDSAAPDNKSDPADKNADLLKSGVSLPLKESTVISVSIQSQNTGRKMPCKIYLPKGYGGGENYPVWYGLHGHSSNESMWLDQVGVAAAADKLIDDGAIKPLIMVFPFTRDATMKEIAEDLEDDGKLSERTMDRFICEELVPYMDSGYDTAASADNRYIGGFSMGGMIALRVAFHHPDLFSKVGGYSAAVISSDYSDRQLEEWLFPYDNVEDIDDIVEFDKKKGLDKLTIYLNCGTNNDPFMTGIQSLYEALQKRGIPAEFEMYKGGHDLEYSKANINEYLAFYVGKH